MKLRCHYGKTTTVYQFVIMKQETSLISGKFDTDPEYNFTPEMPVALYINEQ